MIGLSFDDIVQKICEVKGGSEDEIRSRVRDKLNKLSGLISNEGAAHIVANELGVDLFEIIRKIGLKINKIVPGMRGVGVAGKVLKSYGVRSFKKENREGKVGSFLLGDETGMMRVVLWDINHIKLMEENDLKEGIILKLTDGYVRENNGYKEMHLSNRSQIMINPEDVKIGEIKINFDREGGYAKKQIKDLNEGDFVNIYGTVVQLFEPRFYEACPECGKKLNNGCVEHGTVNAKLVPVLNFLLDDGTGNIRVAVFRDNVNSLLGLDDSKILEFRNNPAGFDEYKKSTLGKQVSIVGKVNKNNVYDNLEITANSISDLDPKELAKDLLNN